MILWQNLTPRQCRRCQARPRALLESDWESLNEVEEFMQGRSGLFRGGLGVLEDIQQLIHFGLHLLLLVDGVVIGPFFPCVCVCVGGRG